MSSASDMSLRSILNMDNLFKGGLKTEYGLYALSNLVKANVNGYHIDAIGILEDLSKINFHELNDKNNANQHNEHIIIDVMYEVANEVAKLNPKAIKQLHQIMNNAEKNNEGFVCKDGTSREEFMQSYKELSEIEEEKEREYKLKEKKELENRIKANKEAILKRRAEEQAAKDRFVENKNKKFYDFDDLEFKLHDNPFRQPQAKAKFENGWGISVLDGCVHEGASVGAPLNLYEIAILDDNGRRNGSTDIESCDGIIRVENEAGVSEIMKAIQKLDKYGRLPQEISEEENVVSGVVVADKIAEMQRNGLVASDCITFSDPDYKKVSRARLLKGFDGAVIDAAINPKRGNRLSKLIKQQYLRNKKQKG